MGIDLELADCAAAGYRLSACKEAGVPCGHEPDCRGEYRRALAQAAADRPGEQYPHEFRYRRFADINEKMQLIGMGYAAEREERVPGPEIDADLDWVSETVPGRTGIPGFKLLSNDRWLITVREIDEALEAYARAPEHLRAEWEAEDKWAAWLEWLAVARRHGGFEAE
ncbi:hypothetical protein AB0M02_27950 [Actinoplanes sp. NPDC051861]|uniref:hypothetical protein n=1 Tax=Actinoplanes sp. NPDC051861 TaxID=3155170 RepID=UPI003414CBFD